MMDEEPTDGAYEGGEEEFKLHPDDVPELPEPKVTTIPRGKILGCLVLVGASLLVWGVNAAYGGKGPASERDLPPLKTDQRIRAKVPESMLALDREPAEENIGSPKIYASKAAADEAAVAAGYSPNINDEAADAVEEEKRHPTGGPDRSYAANTGKGGKPDREEEDESDDDFMPHGLSHGKPANGNQEPEPLTPPPPGFGGLEGLQGAMAGAQQNLAALKAMAAAGGGQGMDTEDRKEAFASQSGGISTLDGDEEDLAECEIEAATPIKGNLLVSINSDVPAQNTVRLMVAQNVYCGGDRQHLAIPQGSELKGSFNARVGYGDERIQLCFKELVRPASQGHPNKSRVNIGCAVGADLVGAVGIPADVDNHWDKILTGAVLSALLGIGPSMAAGNQTGFAPTVGQNAAAQAGNALQNSGRRVVDREVQRKPTLTTEMLEGATVIFTSNIPLEPWVPRKVAKPRKQRITWVSGKVAR